MHTHHRDREKSSGRPSQFNIWTIWATDRISAQPQVNLSLLCSNSLKVQPQVTCSQGSKLTAPNFTLLTEWRTSQRSRMYRLGMKSIFLNFWVQITYLYKKSIQWHPFHHPKHRTRFAVAGSSSFYAPPTALFPSFLSPKWLGWGGGGRDPCSVVWH